MLKKSSILKIHKYYNRKININTELYLKKTVRRIKHDIVISSEAGRNVTKTMQS